MRELLAKHHITQMTMKPVKRQYAFENPAIRPGKQWVLKVRRQRLGVRGGWSSWSSVSAGLAFSGNGNARFCFIKMHQ